MPPYFRKIDILIFKKILKNISSFIYWFLKLCSIPDWKDKVKLWIYKVENVFKLPNTLFNIYIFEGTMKYPSIFLTNTQKS